MRSLKISIAIMLLLFAIFFFSYRYLVDNVNNIYNDVVLLEKHGSIEEWEECRIIYDRINSNWKRASKILMLVVNHDEMEKIDRSLELINAYIKENIYQLFISEITSLKFSLKHLQEIEKITLHNIF